MKEKLLNFSKELNSVYLKKEKEIHQTIDVNDYTVDDLNHRKNEVINFHNAISKAAFDNSTLDGFKKTFEEIKERIENMEIKKR